MNAEESKPIVHLSPWPYTIGAVFFFVLTIYLMHMFSIVHWKLRGAEINAQAKARDVFAQICEEINATNHIESIFQKSASVDREFDKLGHYTSVLMSLLEVYHLTGLLSIASSVVAILRKPRIVGLLGLPFGIIGLFLAISAM